MFVVTLSPSKSHYYVLFIYHVKNIGQVSPNWPIFRNRDIVYCLHKQTTGPAARHADILCLNQPQKAFTP